MGLNHKDTKDLTIEDKVNLAIEYLAQEETQLKRFANFVYDLCDQKEFFGHRVSDYGDGKFVWRMRQYGFDLDSSKGSFPFEIFTEFLWYKEENNRLKDLVNHYESLNQIPYPQPISEVSEGVQPVQRTGEQS